MSNIQDGITEIIPAGAMARFERLMETIFNNRIYQAVFWLIILLIGLWVIDLLIKPLKVKRKGSAGIYAGFLQGLLKAFLIIAIFLRICSLSSFLSGLATQILMSSSLLVVVLGFVFQEGLSNIVHGFILMIFKPFSIGDRVMVKVDGETITGYVQSVDLRSTIITNVMNSSSVIVPNSKMDLSIIDNSYFDTKKSSSNFLDLTVSYETDLDAAILLVQQVIMENPLVAKCRSEKKIAGPVGVMVRSFENSGIALRATVTTNTVEENFAACSEIRKTLAREISKRKDVDFAYPHMQIVSPGHNEIQ